MDESGPHLVGLVNDAYSDAVDMLPAPLCHHIFRRLLLPPSQPDDPATTSEDRDLQMQPTTGVQQSGANLRVLLDPDGTPSARHRRDTNKYQASCHAALTPARASSSTPSPPPSVTSSHCPNGISDGYNPPGVVSLQESQPISLLYSHQHPQHWIDSLRFFLHHGGLHSLDLRFTKPEHLRTQRAVSPVALLATLPHPTYGAAAAAAAGGATTAAGGAAMGTPVGAFPGLAQPMGTRVLFSRSPTLLHFTIPPQHFSLKSFQEIAIALFWTAFVAFWTATAALSGAPVFFILFSIPFWAVGIGLPAHLLLWHIMDETVTVDPATCQLTIHRAVKGQTLPLFDLSTARTALIYGAGVNYTMQRFPMPSTQRPACSTISTTHGSTDNTTTTTTHQSPPCLLPNSPPAALSARLMGVRTIPLPPPLTNHPHAFHPTPHLQHHQHDSWEYGQYHYHHHHSQPTTFCQLTMAGGETLSFGSRLSLAEQRLLSLHIASFLHVPWFQPPFLQSF
ncbi:unnamed protein product [Closterium sp. Naga37s-1]|nr:unnamed protein product [Closterium sp. Naga37s-1]